METHDNLTTEQESNMYEVNKSSAYYRKGYEFGLLIEKKELEVNNEK